MLTLGHTALDAACARSIAEKSARHSEAARVPGAYQARLRAALPAALKGIREASAFFRTEDYAALAEEVPGELPPGIPFMNKSVLRNLADQHFETHGKSGFFRAPTSGSTGEPLVTWFDREYLISYFARMRFLAREWGLEPAPFATFKMTVSVFRHLKPRRVVQPALDYSLYQRVNLNPLFWQNPAEAVDYIAKESPAILHGMPSSLEKLADLMEQSSRPDSIRPSVLVTMAETLLPSARERIERAFQSPVRDTYGLVEVGGIVAEECREQCGFHVNVTDYLVEVVDEMGRPLPDGREGEIVVTNLYQRPVPVLRYRTGDFGVIDGSPCPCGRIEPRIARLAGRALTRFLRPGGKAFNPFDAFGEFLLGLPAAQFRMVQDQELGITLSYRADRPLDDHENVRAIRKAAAALMGEDVGFKVERVDGFEQDGKFQAFLKEGQS